jgi:hypothetical protein
MIYVQWTNYTTNLSAGKIKEVTCEKCQTQFLYALRRTERGMATSVYHIDDEGAQDRALTQAAKNLQMALDSAFECVPCPSCGVYQAEMTQFLKNCHLKWLSVLGFCLLMAGAAMFLFYLMFAGDLAKYLAIGCPAVGLIMIFYRNYAREMHDPNSGDPEGRKRLAEGVAILKKDLPPELQNIAQKPTQILPQ